MGNAPISARNVEFELDEDDEDYESDASVYSDSGSSLFSEDDDDGSFDSNDEDVSYYSDYDVDDEVVMQDTHQDEKGNDDKAEQENGRNKPGEDAASSSPKQSEQHGPEQPQQQQQNGSNVIISPELFLLELEDIAKYKDLLDHIEREDILEIVKTKQAPAVFEMDVEHTQVAMRILQVSPNIREHRFRLVPARLKEDRFWATIFWIMTHYVSGGPSDAEATTSTSDTTCTAITKKDDDDNAGPNEPAAKATTTTDKKNNQERSSSSPVHHVVSSTYSQSFREVQLVSGNVQASLELQDQLKSKTLQVMRLEQELHEAQRQLRQLEESQQQQQYGNKIHSAPPSTTCAKCGGGSEEHNNTNDDAAATPQQQQQHGHHHHSGTWIMNQDSRDFLALDDEIKENLRREKQKRLAEVQSQMKFILDSDELHDSFGEWDCCHSTNYHDKKCAANKKSGK